MKRFLQRETVEAVFIDTWRNLPREVVLGQVLQELQGFGSLSSVINSASSIRVLSNYLNFDGHKTNAVVRRQLVQTPLPV